MTLSRPVTYAQCANRPWTETLRDRMATLIGSQL